MIHHVSLGAPDIESTARFYSAVLDPLGCVRVQADLRTGVERQAVGCGRPSPGDQLSIKQAQQPIPQTPGLHVAVAGPSRTSVIAFHAAALAAGGADNGQPGLRPAYGPLRFAGFVLDPEVHRIEAARLQGTRVADGVIGPGALLADARLAPTRSG